MSEPKYPDIEVQLSGEDGNAFYILGKVTKEMRNAGISKEERTLFLEEAKSGDYDELLETCDRWVTVM